MDTTLTVALCQFSPIWNNPLSNFSIVEELNSETFSDILFLPEMFNTGFILQPIQLKDPLAIKTKKWLSSQSHNKTIIGTSAVLDNGNFYNRLYVYSNEKEIVHYDKKHNFVGEEQANYSSGDTLTIVNIKDWKIGLNICYDLRFPVWCRAQECDILVFCANWPSKRIGHWHALLKARAIENQCYVIGANRIGKDENGWEYNGESVVYDYSGKELINLGDSEICLHLRLSKTDLAEYRTRFPFLKDKDNFNINNIRINKV